MAVNLLILAAGRGSRLGKLTEKVPKCLNIYEGKPLIGYILEAAERIKEIGKVVIVGGYKSKMLDGIGDTLVENRDWETTGTFGSMICANEFLSESPTIVCYSDIIFSDDFFHSCIEESWDIFLPSNKNFKESWQNREIDILDDLESFRKRGNRLIEIGNRPSSVDEVQGQFAGIFRLNPEGWFKLKGVGNSSLNRMLDTTTLLSLALSHQVQIHTKDVEGFWREFDNPYDFMY